MLINGRSDNLLTTADRGFHYGDGLFETLAVAAGRPCLWQRHMQRLQRGCERLRIPFPDADRLLEEVLREIGSADQAVIKIILTRGEGGRGYRLPEVTRPNRMIFCYPWPEYPNNACDEGVQLRVCTTRLGINPALAGLKTLNRLEQVLARSEWEGSSIAEGLMLDLYGHVIEGTMSNLFIMRDGTLITPDLSRCGTAGVMRELIIDTARDYHLPVVVTELNLRELAAADGLFLSNSLIGIWPVRALSDQLFDIGSLDSGLVDEVMARGFRH